MLETSVRTAEDMQRIATLLPDVLGQSLESIKRGKLTVHFDLQHFENLVRQLSRASHVLAVGIVLAGLIVGSAMVFRVGSTSLAYAGFSIGLVLGLWLVWSMSRS